MEIQVPVFLHVYCTNKDYYQAHGRFYQNPRATREIWCTVGLGFKNQQKYPKLEPWMEGFLTEKQFSQLIQFLETEFNECSDELKTCNFCCAYSTFHLTCGVCFCCYLYFMRWKRRIESFRLRTATAFSDQARSMGISNVRLHFAERLLPNAGFWFDSKNQPLDYGPPLGFSMIFTVEDEIQWPPIVTSQVQQAISSAPPPYISKECGESNLSAEFEQDNFCTNCGKKFIPLQRFCGMCGKPLQ